MWNAIVRLSSMWESDLADKIKWDFFQVVAVINSFKLDLRLQYNVNIFNMKKLINKDRKKGK